MIGPIWGGLFIVVLGVCTLVGVSAYLEHQRDRESTPIEVEPEP